MPHLYSDAANDAVTFDALNSRASLGPYALNPAYGLRFPVFDLTVLIMEFIERDCVFDMQAQAHY